MLSWAVKGWTKSAPKGRNDRQAPGIIAGVEGNSFHDERTELGHGWQPALGGTGEIVSIIAHFRQTALVCERLFSAQTSGFFRTRRSSFDSLSERSTTLDAHWSQSLVLFDGFPESD